MYPQPEQSIEDARFSADGRLVAFVTQMSVPDGIEAEEYDEAYGEGGLGLLAERAKREPRFQDPIVRAVDESGREICAAGCGWRPDGSRFALVVTKLGDFSGPGVGKFHFLHDELIVYRTPKAP